MDELGAVWLSSQSDDDLKHKILLTTYELEMVRMEMNKIKNQSEMYQMQLLAQIQLAYEERDEAKQQLQQLLDSFMCASPSLQLQALKASYPSDVITLPTKPNSGINEKSNNNVDSLFDTVSSTENSRMSMNADDSKHIYDESNSNYSPMEMGAVQRMVDHLDIASNVIDQLVDGKVLPCKGRLLEAVMKAGPTLQAMMLSGPLPQWKNPPPPIQSLGLHNPILTNNVMLSNYVCAVNQRVSKPSSTFGASTRMYSATDLTGGLACVNKMRVMDMGNNKRHRMV